MLSNMEIRIIFLRPWVAQKHSKIAQDRQNIITILYIGNTYYLKLALLM